MKQLRTCTTNMELFQCRGMPVLRARLWWITLRLTCPPALRKGRSASLAAQAAATCNMAANSSCSCACAAYELLHQQEQATNGICQCEAAGVLLCEALNTELATMAAWRYCSSCRLSAYLRADDMSPRPTARCHTRQSWKFGLAGLRSADRLQLWSRASHS